MDPEGAVVTHWLHWFDNPSFDGPGATIPLPSTARVARAHGLTPHLRLRTWNFDEPSRDGRPAPRCAGVCQASAPRRLGGRDRRPDRGPRRALVRRQPGRIRPPVRRRLVAAGTLKPLNPASAPTPTSPGPIPSDVARVEDRTFICSSARKTPARPTTGCAPRRCASTLRRLSSTAACAAARCTSCRSRWGRSARRSRISACELSDQPVRRGQHADHDAHGPRGARRARRDGEFVPCVHSVGAPLAAGQKDVPWPCNDDRSTSSISPRRARSGASARATAATRCSARSASRCASPRSMGRDEGWLAEHMLILGVESPAGPQVPRRGGVPVRLRQDQLRDADPAAGFEGWKVTTIGDDIAWIKPGPRRPAARDQSRGRLLRRRAGHERQDQSELRWRR